MRVGSEALDPHPDATVSSRSLCAASGPEPPPRKVLIVGRAYRRRDRLDALLTEAGFTLAAHVPDAHVRAELPASLVLLDGWAAAGEGLSLLRALVDADEPSRCPCLLLASEVREAGPRIAAAQAGCDEVVSADLEPEAIVAWALRAAARPAERDDGRTPARLLLLMGVGDERSALHEALTGAGYDAFTAETTEEGLRRAALVRPDLVIVDDDLRPERGLDAVRLLRRHPELSCAQYLLLASGDTSADEVEALSTGVEGYVRKELGTPSLLARVARLLRGRGPQRTDLAAPWRLVLLDGGPPPGDTGAPGPGRRRLRTT